MDGSVRSLVLAWAALGIGLIAPGESPWRGYIRTLSPLAKDTVRITLVSGGLPVPNSLPSGEKVFQHTFFFRRKWDRELSTHHNHST